MRQLLEESIGQETIDELRREGGGSERVEGRVGSNYTQQKQQGLA